MFVIPWTRSDAERTAGFLFKNNVVKRERFFSGVFFIVQRIGRERKANAMHQTRWWWSMWWTMTVEFDNRCLRYPFTAVVLVFVHLDQNWSSTPCSMVGCMIALLTVILATRQCWVWASTLISQKHSLWKNKRKRASGTKSNCLLCLLPAWVSHLPSASCPLFSSF